MHPRFSLRSVAFLFVILSLPLSYVAYVRSQLFREWQSEQIALCKVAPLGVNVFYEPTYHGWRDLCLFGDERKWTQRVDYITLPFDKIDKRSSAEIATAIKSLPHCKSIAVYGKFFELNHDK